jgi:hypothetical protein
MPKHKTLDEVYNSCLADGLIQDILSVETQKVRDILENAQIYKEGAEDRAKRLNRQDKMWMLVYVDYYESVRLLAEALAHLSKRKITNHQCLFAFIISNYADLELDFNFFEKIRTKRNGVNYYGQKLTYDDWKQVEVQMSLYLITLQKQIEKQLRSKP